MILFSFLGFRYSAVQFLWCRGAVGKLVYVVIMWSTFGVHFRTNVVIFMGATCIVCVPDITSMNTIEDLQYHSLVECSVYGTRDVLYSYTVPNTQKISVTLLRFISRLDPVGFLVLQYVVHSFPNCMFAVL